MRDTNLKCNKHVSSEPPHECLGQHRLHHDCMFLSPSSDFLLLLLLSESLLDWPYFDEVDILQVLISATVQSSCTFMFKIHKIL